MSICGLKMLTQEQIDRATYELLGTTGSWRLKELAEEFKCTQDELSQALHSYTRRCDVCDEWIESGELINCSEGEVCDVCIKDWEED